MCAKDNLIGRKSPLLTSTQTSNYVDTFGSDFAFSFAAWLQQIKCTLEDVNSLFADNILSLIAFIISYCLFADELNIQQSLLDRVTVVLIIILRCLDKGHDDFVHLVDYFRWKHYNFNIHVSLATDTLHLLLKGLTGTEQKAIIQQLIAVVSLLFVLKAPFALHFIRAVYDLVTLAQYKREEKNFNYPKALDGICTRANSEAYYITIPYSTKLPLSEVAVNIAISDFIYAAAVFLYLILIIIDYTCYDKDRKHIAYIRAFSKVLLFNNNRQIDNTTRMLSVPFKFYDLSMIICLVHLVLRNLPDLTTYTTMSYYVNNYIN
ncbi:hypothetical protein HBI21_242420 [Parastagonospora nodorum]|nr:hypothetical protein HBI21_242420 [Parastagonospora nodorum]